MFAHVIICVMVCTSRLYYATRHCHMLRRDHICARLVKYFPTFFVGLNCKCEELSLKQIGWSSPHGLPLTNWQYCVDSEDQEKKKEEEEEKETVVFKA